MIITVIIMSIVSYNTSFYSIEGIEPRSYSSLTSSSISKVSPNSTGVAAFPNGTCSTNWKITGYFTPIESDYTGPIESISAGSTNTEFYSSFLDAVTKQGWGKTGQGDYIGYWNGSYHLPFQRPLDSRGNPLEVGQITTDQLMIPRGNKILIPSLQSPWNTKIFTATDVSSDIKGKQIAVYLGEGKVSEQEISAITGSDNVVCYKAHTFANPAHVPDFNFAAAGDWGCFPNTTNTINNIIDKKPELIFALGDLSYKPTADCWLDLIEPLRTRVRIALGNHDVLSPSLLNQYMSLFNLTKQYYSFDYHNVHFTIMSTEIPYNKNSEQYNFVKNDIAKAAADPNIKWIVVAFHRPFFLEDELEGMSDTYHPLFDQYGVDLVLYAHIHTFDRSYPIKYNDNSTEYLVITDNNTNTYNVYEGQIYATVGTGGAYLHGSSKEHPFIVSQYDGHGFLNVDIINNGTTLRSTFYANDGTIKDQFTITNPFQKCDDNCNNFLFS
jgi:hypothetical protein